MSDEKEKNDIEAEVAEIAEHVEVIVESDNAHLDHLFKVLSELKMEEENFIVQESDLMDKLLGSKFDIAKKIELLEDQKENLNQTLLRANDMKIEASKSHDEVSKVMKEHENRLALVKAKIEKANSESEEIMSRAENVPKLSQNKKLYYSISRITLDRTVSDNEVKGFVVNPLKDDVSTFDFKLSDGSQLPGREDGVSQHFVSNYLWDLIASAADPVWDQV
eukprot:GFUD01042269.1.p1 GENE.GFUD01042269.1~~GFUD01042269.1.p1  ORF type:complete len:221 (-),score=63.92 GFUD01042269.1:85-747(-)